MTGVRPSCASGSPRRSGGARGSRHAGAMPAGEDERRTGRPGPALPPAQTAALPPARAGSRDAVDGGDAPRVGAHAARARPRPTCGVTTICRAPVTTSGARAPTTPSGRCSTARSPGARRRVLAARPAPPRPRAAACRRRGAARPGSRGGRGRRRGRRRSPRRRPGRTARAARSARRPVPASARR